jgi:hypothetical protein
MHQLRMRPFNPFWGWTKTTSGLPKFFFSSRLYFAPKHFSPTYLPPPSYLLPTSYLQSPSPEHHSESESTIAGAPSREHHSGSGSAEAGARAPQWEWECRSRNTRAEAGAPELQGKLFSLLLFYFALWSSEQRWSSKFVELGATQLQARGARSNVGAPSSWSSELHAAAPSSWSSKLHAAAPSSWSSELGAAQLQAGGAQNSGARSSELGTAQLQARGARSLEL